MTSRPRDRFRPCPWFRGPAQAPPAVRRVVVRLVMVPLVMAGFLATANVVAPTASAAVPAPAAASPGRGVADRTATVDFAAAARRASAPSPRALAPSRLGHPGPAGRNRPPSAPVAPLPIGPSLAPSAPAAAAEPLSPPPPAANFDAMDDDNTTIPPDTDGAAGPNHLVTALNDGVRVQTRTGGVLSTVSLYTFFAAALPPGSTGVFDPHVRYDPYGGRWIMTVAGDEASARSAVYLAVSQTSDPTGVWNLFSVVVDPGGTVFADFPLLGFNQSWIVVSTTLFTETTNRFTGSRILVFDKAMLYANTGSGAHGTFNDPNGFAQAPVVTFSPTLSTMYLVEDWDGSGAQMRVSTITGPVGAEVYTTDRFVTLPTGTWADFSSDSQADFAPQAGSTAKIDTGDSRLSGAEYRNGSLWFAHTVFLPTAAPTRASVQWGQITVSPSLAVRQAGRVDDPTGAHLYAYASISANAHDDALLGYSRFGPTQFAGADYSYRAGADPLGSMGPDTVLKAGQGPYNKTFGGPSNRWGDYSTTVVDPVDDASMWTIQEYAATPAASSRWGTWWGRLPGSVAVTRATAGDYDGDERTDLAVFRPATGTWYAALSGGGSSAIGWGTTGDIPVPGDYDGNGTTDVAVFRPSTGQWFVRGGSSVVWGSSGDIPVPGDYDGNGTTDVAVFRPSTGQWFVRGGSTVVWGSSGDIPVPGDYDGNGTTDVAVFRPSTGQWFVLGGSSVVWGSSGDVPVPGDYDGNGTTDVAVYRPSTGQWFVRGGTTTVWGSTGDIPLPLPEAVRRTL